jgi:glycine reductase
MTPIALMIGAPRVVQGVKIVNPTGNEELDAEGEKALRYDIMKKALSALQADVKEPTLFDRHKDKENR